MSEENKFEVIFEKLERKYCYFQENSKLNILNFIKENNMIFEVDNNIWKSFKYSTIQHDFIVIKPIIEKIRNLSKTCNLEVFNVINEIYYYIIGYEKSYEVGKCEAIKVNSTNNFLNLNIWERSDKLVSINKRFHIIFDVDYNFKECVDLEFQDCLDVKMSFNTGCKHGFCSGLSDFYDHGEDDDEEYDEDEDEDDEDY